MCLKTISSCIYKISFGSTSKFIYFFFSFFFFPSFSADGVKWSSGISQCVLLTLIQDRQGMDRSEGVFCTPAPVQTRSWGRLREQLREWQKLGIPGGKGWTLRVRIDGSSIPNQGKSGNERRQFWEEAEEPPAFDNDRINFMCCSLRTFTITILLFMILRGWWSPAQTAGGAQERIPPVLALPNHSLDLRPDQQSSISALTTGNKSVRTAR